MQNLDFMFVLRQYQTLLLLSRVWPANSTAWILSCYERFNYSIMNDFLKQFWHENRPFSAAFLTNLFIRINKDPKFCLQTLGSSTTQDSRVLKSLWHLRHSDTQDIWGTLFSRLQGTTLTGILTMFAKFLDCHHWMLTLKETSTLPHFT